MREILVVLFGLPILLVLALVGILSIPLFVLARYLGIGHQYIKLSNSVGLLVRDKFINKVDAYFPKQRRN